MKQTAAVIISVTALVVAVFGATPVGHAAASMILPKNSVGVMQLKAGAVTGAKVRNGTLTAADFAGGQLPAGAQGPKGEPGPQGPRGADGPTGAPGLSGIEVVTASQQVQAGLTGVAYAVCPGDKKVVAGGFTIDLGYLRIDQSKPATANIWRVQASNSGVAVGAVTAYAVCATAA